MGAGVTAVKLPNRMLAGNAATIIEPAAAIPAGSTASPHTPPLPPVAAGAAARLSVIVPVYNERNTLRELLERVRAQPLTWQRRPVELEVIVVDDCSNDGGVDFLDQAASRAAFPEVRLIRHGRNRGKGAAIRTGLAYTSGNVVLIQDADLEYDPSDYPNLLAPILEG